MARNDETSFHDDERKSSFDARSGASGVFEQATREAEEASREGRRADLSTSSVEIRECNQGGEFVVMIWIFRIGGVDARERCEKFQGGFVTNWDGTIFPSLSNPN